MDSDTWHKAKLRVMKVYNMQAKFLNGVIK